MAAAAVLTGATLVTLILAAPDSAARAQPATVQVPCSAAALASAVAGASDGATLGLAPRCSYDVTASLSPAVANLTIRGNGATVERGQAAGTAPFTMLAVPPQTSLTISDLSFTGGLPSAISNDGTLAVSGGTFAGNDATAAVNGFGAAIGNTGTLTVTGTVFMCNQSTDGGAIANQGAATIADSTFLDNRASFSGGAIHNEGPLTVTGSRFAGNSAGATGGGGAIFNGVDGSPDSVTGTLISNNQALDGGGVYNEDVVSLTRTRISGNHATGQGGAIYTDWVLTAASSTVTGNSASGGGGLYDGDFFGPLGTVSLTGVSLAGNQPDNCEPASLLPVCAGPAAAARRSGPGPASARPAAGTPALARDFGPVTGG
jgi:predicted outer membrane repeat protein